MADPNDWKLRDLNEPLNPRRDDESEEAFNRRIGETVYRKVMLLMDCHNIDRDNPNAELTLVIALAMKLYGGFKPKKVAKTRRTVDYEVRDLALTISILKAKQEDPDATLLPICRAIAERNNWPADERSVKTLRRRYQAIMQGNTREAKQVAELADRVMPSVVEHFRQKKSTARVRE